ncbi:hypothetical protein WL1483_4212 [Aeromonas schubertii]|uniref:Uncharacterized protein n=1 Tax=Aeromonas schubertii TaxID=652 RepID=A0A0S2SPF1_9GAMM|nr:hypothetical protein WL1483_4212 [Aeromonas schubertii]
MSVKLTLLNQMMRPENLKSFAKPFQILMFF